MKRVGLLCGREFSFPPAFIARVNALGAKDGISAEFVKLGGTRMGEEARYTVIVDRISHEVEYYRGYLKHAVLQGTYVINNPFWWTADDKFFNYSVASKLGIAIPKTVLLPQKGYPADFDLTAESLHNLEYPVDWDGLLDYVGRPAILKPYSGGGWKHVYKVHNREELLAAYDQTSPYPMTLQEFIDFKEYVRCFTFGKSDITPVRYDPKERRYHVDHAYLSAELGARVVKDAQTINEALGYEMNTIEFAVKDGIPYAIDFLNPAPDMERDRITEFYFEHVLEKMSRLVIDRALHGVASGPWPRWEEMLKIGTASGFTGAPAATAAVAGAKPAAAPAAASPAPKPATPASAIPPVGSSWASSPKPAAGNTPPGTTQK
jgi:glutathione synthase/RimK-type ligase-like ATP-grasp enzyme